MKLNQVLAIEKGVKSQVYSAVTDLHKRCQKPVLFNGFSKNYLKKDEDGEDYPSETQNIQQSAHDAIRELNTQLTELFDVVAQKDAANRVASADVIVDGKTLLDGIPATTLLFLEKQLNDIRTFVEALPVLDPAEHWTYDEGSGHYFTAPTKTHRTKKVARAIVLYPATVEHPAQTQLISEDIIVGYWEQTKTSAAITQTDKRACLDRINALAIGVKQAREEANLAIVPDVKIGEKVLHYLFWG